MNFRISTVFNTAMSRRKIKLSWTVYKRTQFEIDSIRISKMNKYDLFIFVFSFEEEFLLVLFAWNKIFNNIDIL